MKMIRRPNFLVFILILHKLEVPEINDFILICQAISVNPNFIEFW